MLQRQLLAFEIAIHYSFKAKSYLKKVSVYFLLYILYFSLSCEPKNLISCCNGSVLALYKERKYQGYH